MAIRMPENHRIRGGWRITVVLADLGAPWSKRVGPACFYCGRSARYGARRGLTLDHIVPRSSGNGDGMDEILSIRNAISCCSGCNEKKGSSLPREWMGTRKYERLMEWVARRELPPKEIVRIVRQAENRNASLTKIGGMRRSGMCWAEVLDTLEGDIK